MTAKRLQSIDCLRGVAALTVGFGHAIAMFHWQGVPGRWFHALCVFMTEYGGLGVPLFFVISGFCIHLNVARQRATSGTVDFRFGDFWKRRLWRLYPTYFVVLCGGMLLISVILVRSPTAPILAAYPEPKAEWMARDFAAHVGMLHGFFPLFDQGAGNPALWTLAREEYLYLLYPLVLLLQARLGIVGAAIAIALLGPRLGPLLNSLGIPTGAVQVIFSSVLPAWIQWYLGAIAAEIAYGNLKVPAPLKAFWAVPLWMIAGDQMREYYLLFFGMAFFTLINAVVSREQAGRWRHGGVLRFLSWVGFMSYSLYLLHVPVQMVVGSLLLRVTSFTTPAVYLAGSVVLMAACIAAAWLLFQLLESRFIGPRLAPAVLPVIAAEPVDA